MSGPFSPPFSPPFGLSIPTGQKVLASLPIVARRPPPEGTKAVAISYVLSPSQPFLFNEYQLNAQSGLMLSQVVSLVIDNSQNPYIIQVSHGAFQETISVPPYTEVVVPTFSTTGSYGLSVASPNNLVENITVTLILLNYERAPGSFPSAGAASTPSEPPQVLFSSLDVITAIGSSILLSAGNYSLTDININFSYALSIGSGPCIVAGQVLNGAIPFHSFTVLGQSSGAAVAATIGQTQTRDFPFGLIMTRGQGIYLSISTLFNCSAAYCAINLSGYSLA